MCKIDEVSNYEYPDDDKLITDEELIITNLEDYSDLEPEFIEHCVEVAKYEQSFNHGLIPVQNHNGRQVVRARELYDKLGLNKAHWKRWYTINIINNKWFKENIDWVVFTTMVKTSGGGRPTKDFLISLDFAKHICMMADTDAGHEFRQFFIDLEKLVLELDYVPKEEYKRLMKGGVGK